MHVSDGYGPGTHNPSPAREDWDWYPCTEGGNAVADVLFGKVDPSGKLPMSFPVNVGQVPISYDELPTGRSADPNNKYTSRYLDAPNTPQYPFGYGLSYTTFSFSNLVAPSTVSGNQTFHVTANVTNGGSVTGTDVVQLYLHESDTTILQPVKEARGLPARDAGAGANQDGDVHARPAEPRLLRRAGAFRGAAGPGRPVGW